ncbi:hypothetical protein HYE82_09545 [Streptomyces sp. BR123]|uniref:hypothetical protein n=1 Tax=Streptomyces sp. BR123 TaxID=2749828 RepID=UPI0015C41DD6|nr:hypothetical protein [Streptomyces sp. BR123]NXY94632.1 hypothetical protein [Streptomyces sp. BR123]
MLDTPEAVFEALRENNERPHGLQRTVTAEELVEAAGPFDKPDILVTALMELMAAYEYTGEHRKSPVVFARLLKLWESSPGAFSEWEAHQILWRFKWVATSLLQVPDVPLSTIEGWIGRMRERYETDGHGVQPVAAMRHHVAAQTGTGVSAAYDLWATRPRTRLSDCEACETRHHALYRVRSGDDEAALATWQPVLGGASTCSDEPQMSQAQALLPLVRLGRTDEARSHHLGGYRRVRGMTGMQEEVGLHLEFCALTRNEGRGLEILAENRPLFEATGAPLARLGFLTGVEVLLARLVADGHAGTAVAGPPGRNWTAGELLDTVRSEADTLAAAFDARNGTTEVGDRRRARLAGAPLTGEPLPLGLRTVMRPAAQAPAEGTTAGAGAGGAGAAVAPAVPAIPDDFAELVEEARRLEAVGHPGDTPLWTRIAALADEAGYEHDDRLGPEVRLRAEIAKQHAYGLYAQDREPEAAAAMAEAAELFDRAGMPWDVLAARARSLAWSAPLRPEDKAGAAASEGSTAPQPAGPPQPHGCPDEAEARAGLDAVLRDAEALLAAGQGAGPAYAGQGDDGKALGTGPGSRAAERYLTVLYCRAYAAFHEAMDELPEVSAPTLERFGAATDALSSEAARLAVLQHKASAMEFTANLALRRGEPDRAERELRAALEVVEAIDRPWSGIRLRAVLAQTLIVRREYEEAVDLLHEALALAVRYGDSGFPTAPTYGLLGHAAWHAGDAAAAVRHLSEAAARHDRDDAHDQAADIRLQLADVLAQSGRQEDAVAVLESVAADATGLLDGRLLAQVRLTLARGLRELEEHRAAAEEFLRLADTVAGWEDDRAVHTLVASEAAVSLAMADRWEAARTAYARAVDAHAQAPNPPMIMRMMCEFARLTQRAQGPEGLEAALAHLAEADAVCAAVPQATEGFSRSYESGAVHYQRARVLAEASRFAEALAEAEASAAAHERDGEGGEVPRAESIRLAAVIEHNGLGRTDAATARLTAAAARARQHGLDDAARILDGLRRELTAHRNH